MLRRVVVGTDDDGRSTVVDDATVASVRLERIGGFEFDIAWTAPTPLADPTGGAGAEDRPPFMGPPRSLRAVRVLFPPGRRAGDASPAEVFAEVAERFPGLFDHNDPARGPGMHATPTLDVLFIVSGEMDLVTETGRTTVRAGDVVVQQGTWHSWEVDGDEPCVAVGLMLRTTD